MTLRVAVADDELLARKRLTRLLEAMPNVTFVGAYEGADDLIAALTDTPVDVVLLDIHMPGLTGLDAAALLPEPRPHVIYVTAHREHAVDAFDLGAVDYVLKPVDPARLRRALDRVQKPCALDRLAVATQDGVVLVDITNITHLSFDGALVTVFRKLAPPLITDASLRDLEQRLNAEFRRVHRRHIVNMTHVERLVPNDAGGYEAVIDAATVPVSRQAARQLRAALDIRS